MVDYLNGFVPDIECPTCNGHGEVCGGKPHRRHGILRSLHQEDCPDCLGHGWRPMTQDEIDAAAEAAWERAQEGEPPVTMREQQEAAWRQKQGLRR